MSILKSKIAAAIAAAFATATIASCSGSSSYDDQTISFARLNQSKTYLLEGSAPTFGTKTDLIYLDSASLLVPTIVGKNDVRALQDSIFSAAFDTTGINHKALVDSYFVKSASDIGFPVKELSADSVSIYNADGFSIVSGAVTDLTPNLMVYCVTVDSYAPRAAHGTTVRRYVNYSIASGNVITLSDIFTPAGLDALPAAIAKRAADLSSVFGPTEISALPSDNNFYISATDEIVFVYQQYEAASYAQGIINVPFYPYELSNYMTADGLRFFKLIQV